MDHLSLLDTLILLSVVLATAALIGVLWANARVSDLRRVLDERTKIKTPVTVFKAAAQAAPALLPSKEIVDLREQSAKVGQIATELQQKLRQCEEWLRYLDGRVDSIAESTAGPVQRSAIALSQAPAASVATVAGNVAVASSRADRKPAIEEAGPNRDIEDQIIQVITSVGSLLKTEQLMNTLRTTLPHHCVVQQDPASAKYVFVWNPSEGRWLVVPTSGYRVNQLSDHFSSSMPDAAAYPKSIVRCARVAEPRVVAPSVSKGEVG